MTRFRIAAIGATCAIALGVGATSAPAATQQNGLVNVSLTDINVPIGVAANVCNVSVNVLATATGSGPFGDCNAVSTPTAGGNGNSGNTRQTGLVNISAQNVNVPVGVAANVCNVSANVLASGTFSGPFGDCTAITQPTA